MNFKFIIGTNEEEVLPKRDSKKTEEHFAWCMQVALQDLAHDKQPKRIIEDFIANMQTHKGTLQLLNKNVIDGLKALDENLNLLSKEFIKKFICGIPIPEKNGYLVYREELEDKNSFSRK